MVSAPASEDRAAVSARTGRPKRTDARTIVTLVGPVLFTPAALALADREWTLFGVPAVLVYVFFVWLAGILLTRAFCGGAP